MSGQGFPPNQQPDPAYLSEKVETAGIEPARRSLRTNHETTTRCDLCGLPRETRSYANGKQACLDCLAVACDAYYAENHDLVLSKQALKAERTRKANEDELNRHVMGILRLWRALLSPTASIKPSGKHADVARKALKEFTTGTIKERRRLCMDAVRGLALRPYTGPRGRTANATGATKRHALRYALMDEEHIEEHAGFYRRCQAKPMDWHQSAWTAAIEVEARFRDLWFNEWRRIQREIRVGTLEHCPDCNPDGQWPRDFPSVKRRAACTRCAGHGVAAVEVQVDYEGRPQLTLIAGGLERAA